VTDFNPRLANGRKLHYLGRGYAVLTDDADDFSREYSKRHEVDIWWGFKAVATVDIVCHPLDTDLEGRIEFHATGPAGRVTCVTPDDGPVAWWRVSADKGDSVLMDFRPALKAMA
jgi:hypothetical protein